MTIRVMFATPFWQERSGPEESLLTLLATKAFATEIDPVVAIPAGSCYLPRFQAMGISTVAFEADLLQRTLSPPRIGSWIASVREARRSAADLVAAIRPDVAHSNMETTFGLALAAGSAGIPRVHHVRSVSFARPRLAGVGLLMAVGHWSEAQIAVSDAVAALFPGRRRPAVVENPVTEALLEIPFRPEPTKRPVVLALGRISPQKHLDLFAEVAALSVTDAEFRVVGPVEDRDQDYLLSLQILAKRLGVDERLRFMPPQPAAIALADADILLNVGGSEGFCRVVAEAMTAGLPVVVREGGATRQLVDHGRTGLLFQGAVEGAAAVDRMLGNPGLRRAMAQRARSEASFRFSAERSAQAVIGVYRSVLSGERAAG